jgi:hypothetical protein
MNRRHFLSHLAATSALGVSAIDFTNSIKANAAELKSNNRSAILLWMGGGPSTIDLWDLKPGASTGGPFKPINTNADGIQICEHLPMLSKNMDKLSIIRNMSTREADHGRGRYYMHTGYVPNPNIEHPSYGSIISHELEDKVPHLNIPLFISVDGGSVGPGFLGMTYSPFVVSNNGNIRDLNMGMDPTRLSQRLEMLSVIEDKFIKEKRGGSALDHRKILNKTVNLLTTKQMEAFKVNLEPQDVRERYGNTAFGRGCLMARRLVELGVPFIEVDMGGWDNHGGIFQTLQNQKLPDMDKAMSALIEDLDQKGLLDTTSIIWMGEFGRTPNINGGGGRDHWARSWSVVVGGGDFKRGIVVGETNHDGTEIISKNSYSSEDLLASVIKSLGLSTSTTFTSKSGRPMKIANTGKVIDELF